MPSNRGLRPTTSLNGLLAVEPRSPSLAAVGCSFDSGREQGNSAPTLRATTGREQVQQGTWPNLRLLDHLVGEYVELRRYRHAQRIGGLPIDHEIEPRGLLNRQVAGFCAFENLVHE